MKKALIVTAFARFVKSFLTNDILILQSMGYEVHCAANIHHAGAECMDEYFKEMNVVFHQIDFSSSKPISKETYISYREMKKLFNEIQQISDDIPSPLLVVPNALKLKPTLRYIIENPRIIAESETTITFSHVENNMIADENDMKYIYSQDYIYKNYLLPQEIGRITWGKGETLEEQITEAKICFNKKLINDKWKIR